MEPGRVAEIRGLGPATDLPRFEALSLRQEEIFAFFALRKNFCKNLSEGLQKTVL